MPIVQYRWEKIDRTGLVDSLLDPAFLKWAPFYCPHSDFSRPGGMGIGKENGKNQHSNEEKKGTHTASYFFISNSFMLCSKLRGLMPFVPSLGRMTTSSPLYTSAILSPTIRSDPAP